MKTVEQLAEELYMTAWEFQQNLPPGHAWREPPMPNNYKDTGVLEQALYTALARCAIENGAAAI